jgi:hypothetical protein
MYNVAASFDGEDTMGTWSKPSHFQPQSSHKSLYILLDQVRRTVPKPNWKIVKIEVK